jgi:hypothetical protein
VSQNRELHCEECRRVITGEFTNYKRPLHSGLSPLDYVQFHREPDCFKAYLRRNQGDEDWTITAPTVQGEENFSNRPGEGNRDSPSTHDAIGKES